MKPSKTNLSPFLTLSFFFSLSFSFALSLFALDLITQPQRNASYIGDRFETSGKEKNSKDRIAEGSIGAVGVVWFLYIYIKGQHGGELGNTVKAQCSDTQVQTHTHLTTSHMLT